MEAADIVGDNDHGHRLQEFRELYKSYRLWHPVPASKGENVKLLEKVLELIINRHVSANAVMNFVDSLPPTGDEPEKFFANDCPVAQNEKSLLMRLYYALVALDGRERMRTYARLLTDKLRRRLVTKNALVVFLDAHTKREKIAPGNLALA